MNGAFWKLARCVFLALEKRKNQSILCMFSFASLIEQLEQRKSYYVKAYVAYFEGNF